MRLLETTHMKNFALAFVGAMALALAGCGSPSDTGTGPAPTPGPAPALRPAVAYNFYEPKSEDDLKAETNYGYMVAKAGKGFDTSMFRKLGLEVLGAFSANGGTYYHLYKKDNVLEALNSAKKTPGMLFIEPDLKVQMCEGLAPGAYGTPGDPRVKSELWGVHTTKTIDAWKTYGFGPNQVYVANVDSGIRFAHEDMAGQVAHAFSWFQANGNTPLSYADIGPGIYYEPFDDPEPVDYMKIDGAASNDGNGHGTITCGIMSAVGNNGKGAAGVCWGPKLISYKGMSNSGRGDGWATFGSIWHLAKWKKQNNYTRTIPMNYSLGQVAASYFATDMIEYGLQNGIMVIAATGNQGERGHIFPAANTGAMAVGASNGGDERWPGSCYGNHVSVVAPGMNVVAPYATGNNAYANVTGTSMAAPFVTGLVGYMLTFNPDLKPDQIRTYIERNTDYIGGATGYTEECGWGRINVLKTIAAVKADRDAGTAPPSNYAVGGIKINVVTELDNGEKIPLRYTGGLPIYLYQCDDTGKIANYVASVIAMDSWTDWDGTYDPIAPGFCTAYFPMLRPGKYVAKADLTLYDPAAGVRVGEFVSTPVIDVALGQTEPQAQSLVIKKMQAMFVQTYPTSDPVKGNTADTIVTMWKQGTSMFIPWVRMWFSPDTVEYDTMSILPAPTVPGTYLLWIEPYRGEDGTEFYPGEYALHMTNNRLNWQPSPAPGTYAQAVGTPQEGSKTHERNLGAQLIEFDKVYYGNHTPSNPDGDWYRFVIP